MKNLVIVESPAKAKTIEKFLGSEYSVLSSYGHIRDLSSKEMSIDIENNYQPQYSVSDDKKKLVAELKKAVSNSDKVWLASDEDREGEAIAWHLQETLKLNPSTTQRIVFNEITKPAILNAIQNPRQIDMDLVNAQQARRVLDRIVGYELSPILWSKIKAQLSAGRVQSVAVRLVVDREQEINNFQTQTYFKVTATFLTPGSSQPLVAELNKQFSTQQEATDFLNSIANSSFSVARVETKPSKRSPAPPFTTSTLQQEASRKLGYSVARTMQLAQQLYEEGYITYMRTDSLNLSELALTQAQQQISETFGSQYASPRRYHTNTKGAQEAHEAIRPTQLNHPTINAAPPLQRLYELIWKRTIASQMADAQLERTIVDISIQNQTQIFQSHGEQVKFDGFLKLYIESDDDEKNTDDSQQPLLPSIQQNTTLTLNNAKASQHHTQHPPRYTEASLVKKMEELGIGRPSTYAPTISNIIKRDYVVKEDRPATQIQTTTITLSNGTLFTTTNTENTGAEKNKLFPTDTGEIVVNFLLQYFPDIMDYNFTANVEKSFDEIAEGKQQWQSVIDHFYHPFHDAVTFTQKNSHRSNGERLLGVDPASGKKVFSKIGRFGPIVQIGETQSDDKPRFASLKKGQSIQTITLQEALDLFQLPRTVGQFEQKDLVVAVGRFGPYVRHDSKFYSLPKDEDPLSITQERCIQIIENKRVVDAQKAELLQKLPLTLGNLEDIPVSINIGRFGPYISYNNHNYRIPKDINPLSLTLQQATQIIQTTPTKNSRRKK